MNKIRVIETLDSLPDEFDTEALIEKLLFIEKVEKGMKDKAIRVALCWRVLRMDNNCTALPTSYAPSATR